ncbi:MAG: hypothetical protein CSA26_07995 [Desulfobacterales bacterium]|nr:MAG: hypothetical protein CSA26_07995 [Desulfobacterales bacterium]
MPPEIARAVMCRFHVEGSGRPDILTKRETGILQLLDKGHTCQQITDQLFISHHTVHSHIKQIYEKLQSRGKQNALMKTRKKESCGNQVRTTRDNQV